MHPSETQPGDAASKLLENRGSILDVARAVTRVLNDANVNGAVIGGVAVTLHGIVRAPSAVDVFVPEPLAAFADPLRAAGFTFDLTRREFSLGGVPVRLVSPAQAVPNPTQWVRIDDVRTVSLSDLINLKLRSGTRTALGAQDLADVIDLIRHHRLDGRFAEQVTKPLRDDYRRLSRAVRAERDRPLPDDPYSHSG